MNQSTSQAPLENQVQAEIALKRAREEAAARETAGIKKFINIVRIISWCGALVPVLGIFAIGIGAFIAFWTSVYVLVKGDHTGGFKQIAITIGGAIAAAIVWFIVNLIALSMFAMIA